MKLFYSKGACSLVVRITLNEMHQTCEYEAVDLQTKKTENGDDFLKYNPKGSVPALQIEPSVTLTENAIILQYLADTFHATSLLPAIGNLQRYRVLEWVNYITTEIHKTFGLMFNSALTEEAKAQFVMPLIHKKFLYVDQMIGNNIFLMGNHYCLADGYLFVMIFWSRYFKIDLSVYPNLSRYYDHLKIRPSIIKSLKDEGFA